MSNNACIIIIYLLFATICKGNVSENISRYGLTFKSHESIQDERTSLILTPDKTFDFSSAFSMEFEIKLKYVDYAHGYVFRIISGDSISLDLTSNLIFNKLNFVLAGRNAVLENIEFKGEDVVTGIRWLKIKVHINPTEIVCSVDDNSQKISYSFGELKNVDIRFGKNAHQNFYSTDVSPMTVRNLVLTNKHGTVVRQYPLLKHNKNEVYDEIGSHTAVVENGIWEVDQYLKWKKLKTIEISDKNPQIASDTLNSRIFIASKDSLFIFYLENNYLHSEKINKGAPFMAGGSQLIYDSNSDKLYSYSILHSNLVSYNFNTHEWSAELEEPLPPIQQHNRFFDAQANKLVVFGGYGVHKYNAELAVYDLNKGSWKIDTLSSCLSPRYISAMGSLGDRKLLIMGGDRKSVV